ncbi:MAG: DUF4827 family protein [Paludibacteraceae bacterium]|nr:DUF4827 family protein [Paludibacteraceae bacterium]
MKEKVIYILVCVALVTISCGNNTYSNLRDQEDKLIANYISRNNLNILKELPANDVWGANDYYKVPGYDHLYFHLISRGDSIAVEGTDTTDLRIVANDLIVTRYKKYQLYENADTLSYWTTLDQGFPYEFNYLNTSSCEAVSWHEAVRLMKYPESQCQLIVMSKWGFDADQTSVTPYGYILKIKVKP